MINLDCNNSIYDNLIEYYFHEYFENRDIDISGLNYKQVSNSLYEGAFSYVYKKLFKPDKPQKNNRKTLVDLDDPDAITYIYDIYKDICKDYNITAFPRFFCSLVGINIDTIYSWRNKEYSHNGLSDIYSVLAQNILNIPGQQVQNNLADDKIGLQSLANNDADVGLLYNQKAIFDKARAEQAAKLSLTDLKTTIELPGT